MRNDATLRRQFDDGMRRGLDTVAPDVSEAEVCAHSPWGKPVLSGASGRPFLLIWQVWSLIDSLRPEQMLDAVQQALGEAVELGVVLALGISGASRRHRSNTTANTLHRRATEVPGCWVARQGARTA